MSTLPDNLEEVAERYLTVVNTQGAPRRQSLHLGGVTVHLLRPEPDSWVVSDVHQGNSSARITIGASPQERASVVIYPMTLDGNDLRWPHVTLTSPGGVSRLTHPEKLREDVTKMLLEQIAMFQDPATRGFWAELKSRVGALLREGSSDDLFSGLRQEVKAQIQRRRP